MTYSSESIRAAAGGRPACPAGEVSEAAYGRIVEAEYGRRCGRAECPVDVETMCGECRAAELERDRAFVDCLNSGACHCVDDILDQWHDLPADHEYASRPAWDYLGLTEAQYAAWVECRPVPYREAKP